MLEKFTNTLKKPAVIIIALIVTNLATASFLLLQNYQNNPSAKYPFIDIAREYIPQEHFIVNIQPLREQLQKIGREVGQDNISIYFEFLNTGANVQINNEARFYPASLVKLPVAMVAMEKVETGEWGLDSRLVLYEQDKDSRYGQLYKQQTGASFSIGELLQHLLVESDNTAHNMLLRNLSDQELNELKESVGLDDLFNEKQEVSAKEYSRLFRSLYISSFLKRTSSQQILDWLSKTQFNNSLGAGLPTGTIFAHKIGEDDAQKNYLDSGIVYLPNRPYLLTVMIKGQNQAKAEDLMKQISKLAYEYIKNYE